MKPSDLQLDDACVLLITGDGVILDVRDAACAALGWTREELVNKSMSELLEYGSDLLLNQLRELQAGANAESSFSVSALVRRNDLSHFPATAIVRAMPELDCFVVSFDDLPGDLAQPGPEHAAAPVEPAAEIPIPISLPREVQPQNGNGNGNAIGHTPRFRNIFLSEPQRAAAQAAAHPQTVAQLEPMAKPEAKVSNGSLELAAHLETERQERRRLEARILALNDQLQQLHVQLKSSLESEHSYQKRVCEGEEAISKAEAEKTNIEAELSKVRAHRDTLENDLAQINEAREQSEEERAVWEAEWAAKLEASLAALHESDKRFAHEIATRRGIQDKLQTLQQDFLSRSEKRETNRVKAQPRDVEEVFASDLAETAAVA